MRVSSPRLGSVRRLTPSDSTSKSSDWTRESSDPEIKFEHLVSSVSEQRRSANSETTIESSRKQVDFGRSWLAAYRATADSASQAVRALATLSVRHPISCSPSEVTDSWENNSYGANETTGPNFGDLKVDWEGWHSTENLMSDNSTVETMLPSSWPTDP